MTHHKKKIINCYGWRYTLPSSDKHCFSFIKFSWYQSRNTAFGGALPLNPLEVVTTASLGIVVDIDVSRLNLRLLLFLFCPSVFAACSVSSYFCCIFITRLTENQDDVPHAPSLVDLNQQSGWQNQFGSQPFQTSFATPNLGLAQFTSTYIHILLTSMLHSLLQISCNGSLKY